MFAAAFLWGVSFVVMKNLLDDIAPFTIIAIRFCAAALILLPACSRKLKKTDKAYIAGGLIMGLAIFAAYALQTYGLKYTTPGKNAFLTSTYCIMTPFLYWLLIKKRPDRFNVIAALICIVGVGLITLDSNLTIGVGDALTIFCGLFYALHIIAASRYAPGRDPLLLMMYQFAFGGAAALACAFVFDPVPAAFGAESILSLVFLIAVCTMACQFLQIFGQKHTPPSQAAVIMTFESVFGALTSVLLYKETLDLRLAAGFTLTFAAVLISEAKPSRKRA